MEEKKVKKISLTTIVLIFALIVIVFMGLLIYRIGNEKNSEEEKVKKLEEQVNSLANEKLSRSNSRLENEIEDSEEEVEDKEEKENDKADSSSSTKDGGTFKTNYSSSTESKNESKNFQFLAGTYKSGNVVISFRSNKNFKMYLGDNFFIDGRYDVRDNEVLCTIANHSFYSPEGVNVQAVPKGEEWTFTFDIKDENSLKVNDIQLPDRETEIIISIYNLMDNKDFSKTKDSDYTISGVYYPKYAQGDEPCYVFSSDNKVSHSALWECTGTYTINDAIITINYTDAVDPDGKKAEPKDFNVPDMETLTIIDNNTLMSDINGVIYVK